MAPVFVIAIICGTLVLCVGIITRKRTRVWHIRQEARTNLFNHMVDRFGSEEKFSDYVASEEGQEFLDELAAEQEKAPGKPVSVVTLFRRGVVMAILGTIIAVWGLVIHQPFIFIVGLVMNTIGLGFGISAVILHYRTDRPQTVELEAYEPGMHD